MEIVWTYFAPLHADAATQMAVDALLLEQYAQTSHEAALRFYSMNPPAVTIGRNQRWADVVDPSLCCQRGWEWARRPTGGGALLHRHELNYAVVVSHDVVPQSLENAFRATFGWVAQGLASGLAKLGFEPHVHQGRSGTAMEGRPRSAHGLCEHSLTRYEISIAGRKAVASAQLNLPGAWLQHGTIYLEAPGPDDRFCQHSPGNVPGTNQAGWWSLPPDLGSKAARWARLANALRDGIAGSITREAVFDRSFLVKVARQKAVWEQSNWHNWR